MSTEEKSNKGISRRDFFKGSAFAAVGLATGGVLAGCGTPKTTTQTPAGSPAKYSWETPPAAIPASQIKETIDADVVIVGAGLSGLSAAVRAKENGAKVVVVEKGATWTGRGGHFGVFESREMKKLGLVNDKEKLVREWIAQTGNRVKEELVWLFMNQSGAAMDWFLTKAEASKLFSKIGVLASYYKGSTYTEYPGTHMFLGGPNQKKGGMPGTDVSLVLYNEADKLGVKFYFESPAEQLVKEGDRVVGVVAKGKDGYKRFNASKGVIIATGDIGGNKEMTEAYAPVALKANGSQYVPVGVNTGDGHKMAMWAGGTIEDTPFPTMIHPQAFAWLSYFFLFINQKGNRFMNEDTWVQSKSLNAIRQPGDGPWAFSIFDSKWPEEVKASLPYGGGMFWDSMGRLVPSEWTPDADQKTIQGYIDQGKVGFKADTLDELAQKIGVPADQFKATVARYNELAKAKKDTDFGKRSELLTTIEKGPFYALKFGGALLTVVGGLNVDTKLRVLDAKKNPIQGLYAVGNASGGLYGVDYPTVIPGNSHGRALTWGYIAGKTVTEG
ncbi:FAD-dependent oxidoreductase [Desulfitobacterium sp. Sab5]|uniref:FAD-dependent oxidoreductase n=1 Tax=Desulfitobacterium nosdiversum TaxID=3375356 RepID=UPI003CEEF361